MMNRSIAVAALLGLGCGGGGDPLERPEDIAGWANAASALGVYTHAHQPLGLANGAFEYPDPACPTSEDDGATLVITGGCTDSSERTFDGEVTVERGDGSWTLTFDSFGDDRFGGMARVSGTFTVTEAGEDRYSFEADLDRDGGIESRTRYSGTVAGGYDTATVWNGSGTVSREGIVINSGAVDAVTVDQRRDDDVCAGEGLSGTTTMTSDEHTVVITYDGDTACDEDDAARWSLDGEDQGLVTGVTCAAGGPAGAAAGLAVLLVAFSLRRRR
jgi:uncharacterized protein (TIGR03382 family)